MAGPDTSRAGSAGSDRSDRGGSEIVVVLHGVIVHAEIPDLCDRMRALLADGRAGTVVCDVHALVASDAAAVDALARLQLTAGRSGSRMRLRGAHEHLRTLLTLMGMNDVLRCEDRSGVDASGQAEQREQARGVQEEGDPGDRAR